MEGYPPSAECEDTQNDQVDLESDQAEPLLLAHKKILPAEPHIKALPAISPTSTAIYTAPITSTATYTTPTISTATSTAPGISTATASTISIATQTASTIPTSASTVPATYITSPTVPISQKPMAQSPPTLQTDTTYQDFREWCRRWNDFFTMVDLQKMLREKELIQLQMCLFLDVQRI
ncbi:hypothetical protein SK128_005119 [Halocaridina rubra]|uniref:Uncharacterized protein n=1 Tax=Halocaridina rubra TaxID=373956 RepID=A0AAN8WCB2_HALRR